jgi:hypothetical protein
MPLTFNPGEIKTFQLQAEGYKAYPRHWVGREYKPCSGPGCALCGAGLSPRTDYIIPIAIAGLPESWVFGQTVSQQLDLLTQQGYKLLGLMITVARTGSRQDTRYTVSLAGGAAPPAPPQPVAGFQTAGQVLQQIVLAGITVDATSIKTANRWVELGYNLLAKKEFLEMVAKEVQRLKDEKLWE